jgi:hypothetical protein
MIFNSIFVEIIEDMFWISYSFQGCQTLTFIESVIKGRALADPALFFDNLWGSGAYALLLVRI